MVDFTLPWLITGGYDWAMLSRKLASASWSPSCFRKVLWGLESPQLSTLPGWFTSSSAMAQSPPGTPSAKDPLGCRRWTWKNLPHWSSCWLCWICSTPWCNSTESIIIICSHPRPLQHTSPQYVGLDVRLTNMLQTRSSTLMKRLRSCAVPSAKLLPS